MFTMTTKITPWGNSLGIRIPKYLAKELNLLAGSEVKLLSHGNHITITLAKERKAKLRELLSGVTEENRHKLQFDDSPKGKEIW